ncbi:hypothetical protein [Phenylobacterium sp.]|uniref:hypothetical protein n=1 Tax=Phenylobacterium sp. TaxID=1871053 RepID=UPI0027334C52|nr:hypothetical protein [Phenylobacterium sp.]MDP3853157.1 hypothetical protein [Phenylobacterium sp.]
MLRIHLMAACAAAALSPDKDAGHSPKPAAPPAAGADPVAKADAAPAPLSADEVAPAEPRADPAPAAEGNAAGADVSAPTNAADAKKAAKAAKAGDSKSVVMVWAQPGHETFGIGMMIRTPTELGENLRSAGRARYASEAEIKAAGDAKRDIPDVEGL